MKAQSKWFCVVWLGFCTTIGLARAQKTQDSVRFPIDILGFQDIKKQTKRNDEVYSALRYTKDTEELPFTIFVITAEEIQKFGYFTLVDVLKTIPGIKTSQPGSAEDGETFLMRGRIGNNYTKILLNNIPLQPSMMGGMPIAAQLPIRHAQRIEIILGASSANFGADAATGVINIITKEPERNSFATAESSMGEYGYQNGNFTAGGKVGKNRNVLKYTFFGGYTQRNDLNIKQNVNRVYSPLGIFLVRDINENIPIRDVERLLKLTIQDFKTLGLEAQDVFGQKYEGDFLEPEFGQLPQNSHYIGANLSYKGITLSYNDMSRREFPSIGRSTALYRYNEPEVYYGDRLRRISMSYTKNWLKGETTTNASYLSYRLDQNSAFPTNYPVFNNPKGKSYVYGASDDFFIEQLVAFLPVSNFELVGGASFQYSGNLPRTNESPVPFNVGSYKPFSQKIPQTDSIFGNFGYYPKLLNNLALFAQGYYSLKRFNFIFGARYDNNSFSGPAFNPRIAGLFKIYPKVSLRANFGTAFKAPAFFLAYNSLGIRVKRDSMIYAIVPNPRLKPEKFLTAEIGLHWRLSKNASFDISSYVNRISNSISGTIVELDTTQFKGAILGKEPTRTYRNSLGASTLFGLQAHAKLTRLFLWLDAEGSLSLTAGSEVLPDNNEYIDGFRMVPKAIGKLSLSVRPVPEATLQFSHILVSPWVRRYTPTRANFSNSFFLNEGFWNCDITLHIQLNRNFRFMARCINVFDARYGGIGATGLDIDLFNNPQLGRNLQAGLQFVVE